MSAMATKIQALLAKAASTTNEAEAEAFLAKAQELMRKHQIEAWELGADEKTNHEHVCRRKGAVAPDWDFRLMLGVSRYYGCESIRWWDGIAHTMLLVGVESARVTSIEMHKYLVAVVRKLGRENAERMGTKPDTAARRIGVALNDRLASLAAQNALRERKSNTPSGKNALVIMNQLEAYIKSEFPDLEKIVSRPQTNGLARDLAGNVSLHLQTTGQDEVKRLA